MTAYTLLHNPRCSKSRETLQLLTNKGVDMEVREYLKHPLSIEELKTVLSKLDTSARNLLRTGEEEYSSLGLANNALTEEAILKAIADHPRLLQRPILIGPQKAAVGRPPEQVLEILS
ncbi:arsenate reductase [Pokkaliibacter plantistimulans]|uniref:Arsenate reductase n=1 Tax=Pokkaliibacter plantistimulans TaxID=1635171 RepID=A0ABX5LX21_9GAMM|nr:arsenate reductase (glutaredoxin) [Pokkaliibacter plantistimulans]PXF31207.1 arsenate reductase [Pokkaliibacter plantistimulans]